LQRNAMSMGGMLGRIGVAAFALIVLASCTPDVDRVGADTSSSLRIQVEADMLSGLPNPTWRLDGDQSREVVACLSAATLGDLLPASTEALGFRAFSLSGLPANLNFTHVDVSRGSVIADTSEGKRSLNGCDQLYLLLRSSASAHLNAKELAAIPKGE
jgi:hypothetical protein